MLSMSKVFAIAHYGTLFRAIYGGLGVSKLLLRPELITTAAEVRMPNMCSEIYRHRLTRRLVLLLF